MHGADPGFATDQQELFRLVAQSSAVGMCLVSPEGRFLWVNPAVCRLMGRSQESMLAQHWPDITHPDDVEGNRAAAAAMLRGEMDSYRTVKRYLRGDGSHLWGDVSLACLRGPDGSVRMFVGQVVDVTDAVRAQELVAASEESYRLLAENASDVVSRSDAEGIIRWVSPSVTEGFGWTPEQLVGRNSLDMIHPDDVPGASEKVRDLSAGRNIINHVRFRCADGSYRWISAAGRPIIDVDGRVLGMVVGWRDATTEVAALQELAESEEHYRLLAENASDVIIRADPGGRITWVSPSAGTVLGWQSDEVLGVELRELTHPDDTAPTDAEDRRRAPASTDQLRRDVRIRCADGRWLWMSDAQQAMTGPQGEAIGRVHALRDIQKEHEARETLRFLAYHDPLTLLSTRAVAEERLERLLGQDPGTGARVAVMFIDIDGLKAINDKYGHAAGDEAINEVAQRLLANARSGDTVARFGGDEFVVIVPSIQNTDNALAVADRMRADAAEPLKINSHQVRISISVGVVVASPGAGPSDTLRRADAALYAAKRSGRDRTVLADTAPDEAVRHR